MESLIKIDNLVLSLTEKLCHKFEKLTGYNNFDLAKLGIMGLVFFATILLLSKYLNIWRWYLLAIAIAILITSLIMVFNRVIQIELRVYDELIRKGTKSFLSNGFFQLIRIRSVATLTTFEVLLLFLCKMISPECFVLLLNIVIIFGGGNIILQYLMSATPLPPAPKTNQEPVFQN